MPEFTQYIPITPPRPQPEKDRTPGVGRAGAWFFALAGLLLLGLSGLVTWRWVDRNLLHWGVDDGKTTQVNSAELLERVRAFELATVKHTYDANAQVDASKVFNAGPLRAPLPSWMAGQSLDVTADVAVAAGVDLAKVRSEDMQIVREGNDVRVLITVPAPELLSAELIPNTLDMDTNRGFLTWLKTSVGLSETDMRDIAADQVVLIAKQRASEQGILDDAGREAELRLQTFLNSLPQTGDERVIYQVVARPVSGH
ncbi:MAG: DUF4230 domain-containing protein [Dehalococcoidia bacterium]